MQYKISKELDGIFDLSVLLPEGLTVDHLEAAMRETRGVFKAVNDGLRNYGLPSINGLIRRNQYSGLVSDILTRMLDKHSDFKKLENTAFPDLRNPKTRVGIEIKATTRDPWGTVGHNVASGWFLTAEYRIDNEGLPEFSRIWVGELVEEDFIFRGRSEESRRTITASVRKESWDRKMKIVFQKGAITLQQTES